MMALFDDLMHPSDIFETHPDKKQMYDMFALSVLPEYRGRGIATKLVQEAFKVAKKAGCDCAVVLATNDFTRKIFGKLGMKVLATRPWDQCNYDNVIIYGQVESQCLSCHYIDL